MISTDVSRRPVALRTAAALFLFLNFLYLITSTGRVHTIDEISAVIQAESLTLHGTTAIPQAVGSKVYFGRVARDGEPHSPYPPGQPLLAVPWYALGYFVLNHLPGVPPGIHDLVVSMTCTWSSATFAALAALFAFLLLQSLGLSRRESLLVTMVIALATPLFVYSAWFFSEALTTACWVGAAWALFGSREDTPPTLARAAFAGVLLGFALHVRPTNVFAAFLFLLAMLVRDRMRAWKPAVVVAAVVGAFGVVYLLRNWSLYGSPLDFGYPHYAEGGRDILSFHQPLYIGLLGFLFSPGKSIFLFCPPILLAIPALGRLWRRDRGLALTCGLVPLLYLLFYSHYSSWEGSYSYGPRYLVPSLVLLCVALAAWFMDPPPWWRKALVVTFGAGLFVQLVGLSTNILEDMVKNHYYDAHWYYQMGYSAITGQLRLIAKYAGGAAAPLGMGFDRWFLFAAKAGMPGWIIGVLTAMMVAGLLLSGWKLVSAWHETRDL